MVPPGNLEGPKTGQFGSADNNGRTASHSERPACTPAQEDCTKFIHEHGLDNLLGDLLNHALVTRPENVNVALIHYLARRTSEKDLVAGGIKIKGITDKLKRKNTIDGKAMCRCLIDLALLHGRQANSVEPLEEATSKSKRWLDPSRDNIISRVLDLDSVRYQQLSRIQTGLRFTVDDCITVPVVPKYSFEEADRIYVMKISSSRHDWFGRRSCSALQALGFIARDTECYDKFGDVLKECMEELYNHEPLTVLAASRSIQHELATIAAVVPRQYLGKLQMSVCRSVDRGALGVDASLATRKKIATKLRSAGFESNDGQRWRLPGTTITATVATEEHLKLTVLADTCDPQLLDQLYQQLYHVLGTLQLDFVHDDAFGYLTQFPENGGNGFTARLTLYDIREVTRSMSQGAEDAKGDLSGVSPLDSVCSIYGVEGKFGPDGCLVLWTDRHRFNCNEAGQLMAIIGCASHFVEEEEKVLRTIHLPDDNIISSQVLRDMIRCRSSSTNEDKFNDMLKEMSLETEKVLRKCTRTCPRGDDSIPYLSLGNTSDYTYLQDILAEVLNVPLWLEAGCVIASPETIESIKLPVLPDCASQVVRAFWIDSFRNMAVGKEFGTGGQIAIRALQGLGFEDSIPETLPEIPGNSQPFGSRIDQQADITSIAYTAKEGSLRDDMLLRSILHPPVLSDSSGDAATAVCKAVAAALDIVAPTKWESRGYPFAFLGPKHILAHALATRDPMLAGCATQFSCRLRLPPLPSVVPVTKEYEDQQAPYGPSGSTREDIINQVEKICQESGVEVCVVTQPSNVPVPWHLDPLEVHLTVRAGTRPIEQSLKAMWEALDTVTRRFVEPYRASFSHPILQQSVPSSEIAERFATPDMYFFSNCPTECPSPFMKAFKDPSRILAKFNRWSVCVRRNFPSRPFNSTCSLLHSNRLLASLRESLPDYAIVVCEDPANLASVSPPTYLEALQSDNSLLLSIKGTRVFILLNGFYDHLALFCPGSNCSTPEELTQELSGIVEKLDAATVWACSAGRSGHTTPENRFHLTSWWGHNGTGVELSGFCEREEIYKVSQRAGFIDTFPRDIIRTLDPQFEGEWVTIPVNQNGWGDALQRLNGLLEVEAASRQAPDILIANKSSKTFESGVAVQLPPVDATLDEVVTIPMR
ncbi:hypothetical protein FOL47_000616 [Perkinsus chesapeaki]|uniref:Uncharacterized protein n=1 Tax=Perkinsus chesapeaki TaxID=330153 RepID=A0A7J6MLK1_PERCH|nr:hypothetical protein FOL47_000616 [Perkinsus chesapeaki]